MTLIRNNTRRQIEHGLKENAYLSLVLSTVLDISLGAYHGQWALVDIPPGPDRSPEPCLLVRMSEVIKHNRAKMLDTQAWGRLPEKTSSKLRNRLAAEGLLLATAVDQVVDGRRMQGCDAVALSRLSRGMQSAIAAWRMPPKLLQEYRE